MVGMAEKPRKTAASKPAKKRGPVLFMTLDAETEAALVAYIAAQEVEPDRSAVGIKALRLFLSERKYLKPDPR